MKLSAIPAELVFQLFAAVAFVCSFSIFLTAFVFPSMRQRLFFQIILLIAVCDMGGAAGAMIGFPEDGTVACSIQGFLISVSYKSSWLWTTVLSYQLYCVVKYGKVGLSYFTMHLVTWPIALLMTILPLCQVKFGRGGIRDPEFSHAVNGYKTGWCDLSGYTSKYFLWKLFSWELELIICFVILVYFALSIRTAVKEKQAVDQAKFMKSLSSTASYDDQDSPVHIVVDTSHNSIVETVDNPLNNNANSTNLTMSNSDITTGSGMDVLKIKMLTESVGRPVYSAPVVPSVFPSLVAANSLSNKFDHSKSQKSGNGKHRSNTNSSNSNSLPKQSSSRKTANMISSTLYLYPLCVALTWGPFLVYSLLFEYGGWLSGYHGKTLYNNLLFNYLSGLAVQSGTFLTLVFFLKSKYARDEWMKLFRKCVITCGCDFCFSSQINSQMDYQYKKWKSISVASQSIIDDSVYRQSSENGGTFEDESMHGGSRVVSNCSVGNGANMFGGQQINHAYATSRRNSLHSERYSLLNASYLPHDHEALGGVGDFLLSGEEKVGNIANDTTYENGDVSYYEDEDDDTLILGTRTESISISLSDAILSTLRS